MIERVVNSSILNAGTALVLESTIPLVKEIGVFAILLFSLLLYGTERMSNLINPLR